MFGGKQEGGERAEGAKSGRALSVLVCSLVVLVVVLVGLTRATFDVPAPGRELSLGELNSLGDQGRVVSARLLDVDAQITGSYCPKGSAAKGTAGKGAAAKGTAGKGAAAKGTAGKGAAAKRAAAKRAAAQGAAAKKAAAQGAAAQGAARGAAAPGVAAAGRCARPVSFHGAYPRSDVATAALISRLGESADVVVDHQSAKEVGRLVITFLLPLLILANLFGLIFVVVSRGGDSGVSDVAGFGRFGRKGKRKKLAEDEVTFADVAGVGVVVTELQEVIDYLQDPGKFAKFAAVAPKGVLLFGPPGCGKTLLARAVAGESGVPFVTASGTEFVESLVGVGAARVRDLFSQVRELAPAILFIDEIDAVGRRREGEGVSGGEREQTLNQLLVEMDGFEVSSGVVLMGATNRPDILDPALLRQGRFDRHITLEAPDADGRAEVLAVHARSRPLAEDVDLALIAKRTPGFTGADLASVINEAALLAVREGMDGGEISSQHVSEAVERVLHGPHRGKLMSPAERHRLAVHESGHAIVAAALGRGSELHRVSILAQAAGLAKTSVTGDGDRVLLTDRDIVERLTIAMAGSAAEQLLLGHASTVAEDDIARATSLAKDMVGLYGMSEGLGPVRVLQRFGGFLGNGSSMDAVAEHTITAFDAEVRRLIESAREGAGELLADRRDQLERLVKALEEEETLEGPALERLIGRVKPAAAVGEDTRRLPPLPGTPGTNN